ncbi:MAG: DNA polymerase III subunit delta [Peptococcaceae bacterium]|nr:DNA polymerase III subunit delta [Peptococcaceae bacterium]
MEYFRLFVKEIEQGQFYPVYLLHGEEVFLHRKAVERLKEALLPPGMEAFNYQQLDGDEITAEHIVQAAQTHPVMAERRLVVVKHAPYFGHPNNKDGEKLARSGEKSLLRYLEHPVESTSLVFLKNGAVDKRKKAYQLVSKVGKVMDCQPLRAADAAKWVAREGKKAGKRFTDTALHTLVQSARGGLQGLQNDLQKVLAYAAEKDTIDHNDVSAVVVPSVETTVFQVIDAIVAGKGTQALEGIDLLLEAKESPFGFLSLLARHLRIMLAVKELRQAGLTPQEMAARLKVHPFSVRKALDQGRKFERRRLIALLEEITEIDAGIKSGRQDFRPAMADFIIKASTGS